ncbi:protein Smaug homolog 2-like isoform X2 [Dreissena polymorpha]|uniref:protein Smaug homolog 2-like isoform X2 n=1 Tax=Dreissena polymorpha TaxID=45954 RepID=UPI002264DF73|nr:protein Smaug homolog 2-like isoform X2 [Dreissena polymorpha]
MWEGLGCVEWDGLLFEYISMLQEFPKEKVIQELLVHLPLLHAGNSEAKKEYLAIIPTILAHSIKNSIFIEESRQLLSYSLIHPAITSEERSKFNLWLCQLDESFSGNYHHSPSSQGNRESSPSHSPGQGHGQLQGQVQNMPFSHQTENSNSLRTHMALSKRASVGSVPNMNGWNNVMFHTNDSIYMNGVEGHGVGQGQVQSGSQGNLYMGMGHGQGVAPTQGGGGVAGHMPLKPTLSAPPNFSAIVPPPTSLPCSTSGSGSPVAPPSNSHHAPLRRMPSMAPPASLPVTSSVHDWLQSNHAHLTQSHAQLTQNQGHGSGRPMHHEALSRPHEALTRPLSGLSDHAPLSPQSSTASSGSGSDLQGEDCGPHPARNTFVEEGSGMRDVPVWLKSLRLHKYAFLFQQLSYEGMLNMNDEWLEAQHVTKGARNKIMLYIRKLQERQETLRKLEQTLRDGGSVRGCIQEMRDILRSPLKTFQVPAPESPLPSLGPTGDGDTIQEGDIPAQFTRLMTKVYSQLMLASPYDDEGLNTFLQLIDKCINHEAFSHKQKRLLDSFKQQARKIWQPAPIKYGFDKKPRPYWGNTFPIGNSYSSRPMFRQGFKPPVTQHHSLGPQWSFGARRAMVGGMNSVAHLPLHRNNSHNTAVFSRPSVLEQQSPPQKQPLTHTQSAPLRSQGFMFTGAPPPHCVPMVTDTEINARLDSLCRSVTECALSGSDGNERGSAY